MRGNGIWLLVILSVVGLAAWGFSQMPGTPTVASASPAPMLTAASHLFPSIDLAPMAGVPPGDRGYAEVKKLTNPYRIDRGEAAEKGKILFGTNCAMCHGPNGLGDGPAGMSLMPKPDDLTQLKSYQHGAGDSGVFRTIKYGVDGTGMAPWEGRMTDEEAWKVTQYVRCIQVVP